jgi:hypothetical protein
MNNLNKGDRSLLLSNIFGIALQFGLGFYVRDLGNIFFLKKLLRATQVIFLIFLAQ